MTCFLNLLQSRIRLGFYSSWTPTTEPLMHPQSIYHVLPHEAGLFVGFMNVYWLSYVTGVCICRKIHEETPEQSELICQAYLEVFWASSWKQPSDSLSCRTGQKESFIHPQNNNIWAGCTSGISKQG